MSQAINRGKDASILNRGLIPGNDSAHVENGRYMQMVNFSTCNMGSKKSAFLYIVLFSACNG